MGEGVVLKHFQLKIQFLKVSLMFLCLCKEKENAVTYIICPVSFYFACHLRLSLLWTNVPAPFNIFGWQNLPCLNSSHLISLNHLFCNFFRLQWPELNTIFQMTVNHQVFSNRILVFSFAFRNLIITCVI